MNWLDDRGMAADLTEAKYLDLEFRQREFAHVQEIIEAFFLVQDSATAYHDGQGRGLPIAPVRAPEEVLRDEHLREREFFVPMQLPTDEPRTAEVPGSPYRFSAFAARPRSPARLGADTGQVLAELDGGSSHHVAPS